MKNLLKEITIVTGNKMSLVYSILQKKRMFVPNSILKQIPESDQIPVYRSYGTGRFTPVWVKGKVLQEFQYAWEKMPHFVLGDETHKFKGEEYPIVVSVEILDIVPAKPIKTYAVNELWDGSYDWTMPDIRDSSLKETKQEQNILSLLDRYYCFDEQAVEVFDPIYMSLVEKLNSAHNAWKKVQEFKIGEKIMGLEIVDITKNQNESASYEFEDDSELPESEIWNHIDKEIPPHVEKIRFRYGEVEYFINGEWCDEPEEEEIDF